MLRRPPSRPLPTGVPSLPRAQQELHLTALGKVVHCSRVADGLQLSNSNALDVHQVSSYPLEPQKLPWSCGEEVWPIPRFYQHLEELLLGSKHHLRVL